MPYKIVLRRNGRQVGMLGPFTTQALAVRQGQALADDAADDVVVTVEPVKKTKPKTKTKNPRRNGEIDRVTKHTYKSIDFEVFREMSPSGWTRWKAWAYGLGQLASEDTREAALEAAREKLYRWPWSAATKEQAAYRRSYPEAQYRINARKGLTERATAPRPARGAGQVARQTQLAPVMRIPRPNRRRNHHLRSGQLVTVRGTDLHGEVVRLLPGTYDTYEVDLGPLAGVGVYPGTELRPARPNRPRRRR